MDSRISNHTLLRELLNLSPLYGNFSEEALTEVVDEFLEEGLMIIDVSETFDDAPIILHYDFWKKKLTDGNPFYVLVDLLVTICSCKRHQEAIPRSQQDN